MNATVFSSSSADVYILVHADIVDASSNTSGNEEAQRTIEEPNRNDSIANNAA